MARHEAGPSKGDSSPWGRIDYRRELAPGVVFVGTPSHGGIWLSHARRAEVAEFFAREGNWLGNIAWWEEDVDAGRAMSALGLEVE